MLSFILLVLMLAGPSQPAYISHRLHLNKIDRQTTGISCQIKRGHEAPLHDVWDVMMVPNTSTWSFRNPSPQEFCGCEKFVTEENVLLECGEDRMIIKSIRFVKCRHSTRNSLIPIALECVDGEANSVEFI